MSPTRTSARVVLLDEACSVLLFCGSDPAITDCSAACFLSFGDSSPMNRSTSSGLACGGALALALVLASPPMLVARS